MRALGITVVSALLLATGVPAATAAVDLQAPSVPTVTAASVARGTTVSVGWKVADAVRYDVRRRSSPSRGSLGGYATWFSATLATAAVANGAPGTTSCWSARARDAAGNVSDWSTEACTSFAFDETNLARRGFSSTSFSGYTHGHAATTLTKGATLSLASASLRRVTLLANRCASCGTLGVLLNGTQVATVSLAGATATSVPVTALDRLVPSTAALTLKVLTSGKRVTVDGVAVTPAAVSLSAVLGGGAAWSRSRNVSLTMRAAAARAPLSYRGANGTAIGGTFTGFVTSRTWTLPAGDGQKSVALQLRDAGGQLSPPVITSVGLDTAAPTVAANGPAVLLAPTPLPVTATVADATSGLASVALVTRVHGTIATTSTPMSGTPPSYQASVPLPPSGDLDWWVVATDRAGNVRSSAVQTTVVDRSDVPAPLARAGGASGSVVLSWIALTAPTLAGYDVQSGPSAAGPWTDAVVAADATSYTEDVPDGTTRWLRVRGRTTTGAVGPWSAPSSATAHEPTTCGDITLDEVWLPGLHVLTCPVTVKTGATLLVQPGALVKGVVIAVEDGARLAALGTAAEPAVLAHACDDSVAGHTTPDTIVCDAWPTWTLTVAGGADLVLSHVQLSLVTAEIGCLAATCDPGPKTVAGLVADSSVTDSGLRIRPASMPVLRSAFVRSHLTEQFGAPVISGNSFTGADDPVLVMNADDVSGVTGNTATGTPRQTAFELHDSVVAGRWHPDPGLTFVLLRDTVAAGGELALGPDSLLKPVSLTVAEGGTLSGAGTIAAACDDLGGYTGKDTWGCDLPGGGAGARAPVAVLPGATILLSGAHLHLTDLVLGCQGATCEPNPGTVNGSVVSSLVDASTVLLRPASVGITGNTFTGSTLTTQFGTPVITGNAFSGHTEPVSIANADDLAGVHGNTAVGTAREGTIQVIDATVHSLWQPEPFASGIRYLLERTTVDATGEMRLSGGAVIKVVSLAVQAHGLLSSSGSARLTSGCDADGGDVSRPEWQCGQGQLQWDRGLLTVGEGGVIALSQAELRQIDGLLGCNLLVCSTSSEPAHGSISDSSLYATHLVLQPAEAALTQDQFFGSTVETHFGSPLIKDDSFLGQDYPVTVDSAVDASQVVANTGGGGKQGTIEIRTSGITAPMLLELTSAGIVHHWSDVTMKAGAVVVVPAGSQLKTSSLAVTAAAALTVLGTKDDQDPSKNNPGALAGPCETDNGGPLRIYSCPDPDNKPHGALHLSGAAVLTLVKASVTTLDVTGDASVVAAQETTLAAGSWDSLGMVKEEWTTDSFSDFPLTSKAGLGFTLSGGSLTKSGVVLSRAQSPSITGNTWTDTEGPLAVDNVHDVSGLKPDNKGTSSDDGTPVTDEERKVTLISCGIGNGKVLNLAAQSDLVYEIGGLAIPEGATLVASGSKVFQLDRQDVYGTLNAGGTDFVGGIGAGFHALPLSTVDISTSKIPGDVISTKPYCTSGGASVSLTGNTFTTGGRIENCRHDDPENKLVVASGNTGVSYFENHSHLCIWPEPPYPEPASYDLVYSDVAPQPGIPTDPICKPGYVNIGHPPGTP